MEGEGRCQPVVEVRSVYLRGSEYCDSRRVQGRRDAHVVQNAQELFESLHQRRQLHRSRIGLKVETMAVRCRGLVSVCLRR